MSPEDLAALHARQEQAEPPVERSFRSWIRRIRAALTVTAVEEAIRTGVAQAVQAAITIAGPLGFRLRSFAEQEGRHAVAEAVAEVGERALAFGLSFDIIDPRFEIAVEEAGARAIREVTQETRDAVSELVARAYRNGWNPYTFAPQISRMVGLTRRQSAAAGSYYAGLLEDGEDPARAAVLARRYSDRLLKQRGRLVARTETMKAANLAREAGFRQAGEAGLFDPSRAVLEWMAGHDARVCPECEALDGEQRPLAEGFAEGPPAHPACRCVTWPRFL